MIKKNLYSEISAVINNIAADRKKIILAVLVAVAAVYLDFSLIIGFQRSSVKSMQPRINKVKADLAALNNELTKMQEAKNKDGAAQKEILARAQKLIVEDDVAGFLKSVSDLAAKNSVRVVNMKPAISASSASGKAARPGLDKLMLFTLSMELIADYHHLGKFINDLENFDVYIVLQSMRISVQPNDYFKQKISLVLRTYVRK